MNRFLYQIAGWVLIVAGILLRAAVLFFGLAVVELQGCGATVPLDWLVFGLGAVLVLLWMNPPRRAKFVDLAVNTYRNLKKDNNHGGMQ